MSGLRGTLEGITLADVMQLFHAQGRSGLLQVQAPTCRGVLYLRGGSVVHAETLSAEGEAAALDLLTWNEGSFTFVPTPTDAPATIHRSTQDLLLRAARLEDSRRLAAAILPDALAIPWPRRAPRRGGTAPLLGVDTLRVLPFLDGYRDFREVAEAAACHEAEVRHAVALLLEADHLELLSPQRVLRVQGRRGGLPHPGAPLEVAQALEGAWRGLEPYAEGVARLRLDLTQGATTEAVRFTDRVAEGALALPTHLMAAWGLREGDAVTVRPAR